MADIVIPAILFLCMAILHILRQRAFNPLMKFVGDNYEIGAAATFGRRQK